MFEESKFYYQLNGACMLEPINGVHMQWMRFSRKHKEVNSNQLHAYCLQ